MFLFLFIFTLLLGGVVLLLISTNTSEIVNNWPKYRCSPTVIPFAAFYGHDAAENFDYCLKNILKGQTNDLLGPFGAIMANFIGTLSTLVQSANSMRVQMATLVGGVTKITQEFQDRITQVMFRTQITASRMKMLMGRLFATFYSIIYMGMSGITAVTNLGDTFLFKFLDTFCFPPDTLVQMKQYPHPIPISSVKIGDQFEKTGGTVTGFFSFYADGQPMVRFPDGTRVSTNHYLLHGTKWIRSDKHPDTTMVGPWDGNIYKPLICLNTDDHRIPIGEQLFMDYDEVSEADKDTMGAIEKWINNADSSSSESIGEYSPSVSGSTLIRMANGKLCEASSLRLGDIVSTGRVSGCIHKLVQRVCFIAPREQGDSLGEGTLCWDTTKKSWTRAGNLYDVSTLPSPVPYYSFVITPTASIELTSGLVIRDYVEIHDPRAEAAYAESIEEMSFLSVPGV